MVAAGASLGCELCHSRSHLEARSLARVREEGRMDNLLDAGHRGFHKAEGNDKEKGKQ